LRGVGHRCHILNENGVAEVATKMKTYENLWSINMNKTITAAKDTG
jgi:hypothetical protein